MQPPDHALMPLTWPGLPSALTTAPAFEQAAPAPTVAAAPVASQVTLEQSPAAAPPSNKKMKAKASAKRTKWTHEMVGELLRLGFADGDVKRRLEAADTKTKKALAWQHFASVLSQSLGVVLTHDHVSLKYRKLKCMFRKEKRESRQTGNNARESEMDPRLWAILSDAFGGRVGISGEVLLDSTADEEEDENDAEKDEVASKQKAPPVVQLASALQGGMDAIAASLGARTTADENFRALAESLQKQQEDTRRFQEM